MTLGKVMVLGGYGGFGARLARRLAADGWEVLVAGRNQQKAIAFATQLRGAHGIRADRSADLLPLLEHHRPMLVIDAAGPFQDSGYGVVEACIAARIHYADLADARHFVSGIGAFDAAAQAAGVSVISGASSVPALSGAVLRMLTSNMEQVASIDTTISATTRASSGRSVVGAALSYAGRPVELWRRGERYQAPGWSMLRREHFVVEGAKSLSRLVGLADVPDLDLFPDQFPGRPEVTFRGGSESALQMFVLWLLGWPVRLGWVRSMAPLAGLLAPLQQATALLGGQRSAMGVEVTGTAQGKPLCRRWDLIAEAGQGQEIPTLAAQLLARRLANGELAPGARDASRELALEDFAPLLEELPVRYGTSEKPIEPLYRRVLGPRFDRLAKPLQALHAPLAPTLARGPAQVSRGLNPLARLIGAIMRFPPAGEYSLTVSFDPSRGRERWTRTFGTHCFSSELSADKRGLLVERFGHLRFGFAVTVDGDGGLQMDLHRWSAFGIPLPLVLAPRITASERDESGLFEFDVAVAMPLIGPVVHYRGTLAL